MVFGDSGAGKTFVVLDWVLRIASEGIDRWGENRVSHGGVIYLAGEGHYGLRARIAGWKKYFNVPHLNAWVSESNCDLNTPEGLQKVVREVRAINCPEVSVIVIDTLHRFLFGDENKATDTKTMLDACAALCAEFDCAVILVHHTGVNQEAKGRARGSSAWRGALDNQVLVEAVNDTIKITQTKNKDCELASTVYLEKIPVLLDGWIDEDGEQVSTLVLGEMDSAIMEKTQLPKLSKSQHFGVQCYRKAIELYGKIDEDGEPYVELAEWREIFNRTCEGEKDSTIRQKFKRARLDLIDLGVIRENDDRYYFSDDYALEKNQIKKLIRARRLK